MIDTRVTDCTDKLNKCSCGNEAIKEVLERDDWFFGRKPNYYCSDCFEEWKGSKEPNPEEYREFLLSKGIDPAEIDNLLKGIFKDKK